MKYTQFEQYLCGLGCAESFVSLCLRRIQEVERAFGKDAAALVQDDVAMEQALRDLEWRLGRNDLDNYQNVLRHYYQMVHGAEFNGRVDGNRRLRDEL